MASTAIPATSRAQLERADESWVDFRLAIAAMGLEAFGRTTPAGWTQQALIAHVAAWHEVSAERLRDFRASGDPSPGPDLSDDAFNARVARDTAALTPAAVVSRLDASWSMLRAEIAALSDRELRAHDGWAASVVAANTFDHYREHRVEVFAEVPLTPRALRMSMDAAWRRFRAAAVATDLERTSSAGWTRKSMLAHVAYWMSQISVELPVRLAGRRSPTADVDAANARAAERAAALDRAGILALLDRGYRETVDALAALPPDVEVDFMAVRLVAGETYEHFRQHAPELEDATA